MQNNVINSGNTADLVRAASELVAVIESSFTNIAAARDALDMIGRHIDPDLYQFCTAPYDTRVRLSDGAGRFVNQGGRPQEAVTIARNDVMRFSWELWMRVSGVKDLCVGALGKSLIDQAMAAPFTEEAAMCLIEAIEANRAALTAERVKLLVSSLGIYDGQVPRARTVTIEYATSSHSGTIEHKAINILGSLEAEIIRLDPAATPEVSIVDAARGAKIVDRCTEFGNSLVQATTYQKQSMRLRLLTPHIDQLVAIARTV